MVKHQLLISRDSKHKWFYKNHLKRNQTINTDESGDHLVVW